MWEVSCLSSCALDRDGNRDVSSSGESHTKTFELHRKKVTTFLTVRIEEQHAK